MFDLNALINGAKLAQCAPDAMKTVIDTGGAPEVKKAPKTRKNRLVDAVTESGEVEVHEVHVHYCSNSVDTME